MNIKVFSAILVVGLVTGFILFVAATTTTASSTYGKGLSIVTMEPDTADTMHAQGKAIHYPFPNLGNNGKKFNPQGDTILPLTTAHTQKILVIFVHFTTLPPGGPISRLDLL